jgi:hypothetical protein
VVLELDSGTGTTPAHLRLVADGDGLSVDAVPADGLVRWMAEECHSIHRQH